MEQEIKNEERVVYCRRCGRELKGKYSKDLGFGPRCYSLWRKERNQQLQLFDIEEIKDNEG